MQLLLFALRLASSLTKGWGGSQSLVWLSDRDRGKDTWDSSKGSLWMKEEGRRINLVCFYTYAFIFPLSIEKRNTFLFKCSSISILYTNVIYWRQFILTEITKYSDSLPETEGFLTYGKLVFGLSKSKDTMQRAKKEKFVKFKELQKFHTAFYITESSCIVLDWVLWSWIMRHAYKHMRNTHDICSDIANNWRKRTTWET
jgi:hypothetical protein